MNANEPAKKRYLGMTSAQIIVLAIFLLVNILIYGLLFALLQLNSREILGYIYFPLWLWMIGDHLRLTRRSGKLRRGVKIWQEEVSSEALQALRNLYRDVKTEKGYAWVDEHEVLIRRYYWPNWRVDSYWGYIDVNSKPPRLEYRLSLAELLFWGLFIIVFPPLGLILILIPLWISRRRIKNFIKDYIL